METSTEPLSDGVRARLRAWAELLDQQCTGGELAPEDINARAFMGGCICMVLGSGTTADVTRLRQAALLCGLRGELDQVLDEGAELDDLVERCESAAMRATGQAFGFSLPAIEKALGGPARGE